MSMHSWPEELANGLDGLPPLRFVVDYVNTSVGSVYSPFEMGISEMGSRSSVPIASLWR